MSSDGLPPTRPGSGGRWAAALLVVVLGGGAFWLYSRQQAGERRQRVTASAQRFTWGPATAEPLPHVTRGEKGEVHFHVTLEDAPAGDALPMACTWTAADGRVHHRNRWSTRPIDHTPWVTHCKDLIEAGAPAGTWKVAMTLDGRLVAEGNLEVR